MDSIEQDKIIESEEKTKETQTLKFRGITGSTVRQVLSQAVNDSSDLREVPSVGAD